MKRYGNTESFDYYCGYSDCLKAILNRYDEITQKDPYYNTIRTKILTAAMEFEIAMHEHLQDIYGPNYGCDKMGRPTLDE